MGVMPAVPPGPSALAVEPLSRPPDVSIEVPGSKSHTNRALICAALAEGRSHLGRVLFADDTAAMLGAIATLGVTVEADPDRRTVTVDGPLGSRPESGPRLSIDVRQSGTTSRFLLPVLAATAGRFLLDGDPQLRRRPFGPQLEALRSIGAEIDGDALPLMIDGRRLAGRPVEVSASISSQFLSGLLMAAPLLSGTTSLAVDGPMVSRPYVDLTVDTMRRFGVDVSVDRIAGSSGSQDRFTIEHGRYRATDIELEPDASAASYFFAAAAITGGRVRIDGLGPDTVQGDLGFVDVLSRMGATVVSGPDWTEVRGGERLRGITVDMSDISDTAQTLAVVAAFADSPTEITGIGFVRFKETDRIAAVATELNRQGIEVKQTDDGMIIHPGTPSGGLVETYEDHRMAMSFALLGLRHQGIEIDNPGCVSKTFPDFFEVLDRLR